MKTWPCMVVSTLLLLGHAAGCAGKKRSAEDKAKHEDVDTKEPRAPRGAVQAKKGVERKIIYTATLKLQVEDFARAEEELLKLAPNGFSAL